MAIFLLFKMAAVNHVGFLKVKNVNDVKRANMRQNATLNFKNLKF